jgi:hypothetical protein
MAAAVAIGLSGSLLAAPAHAATAPSCVVTSTADSGIYRTFAVLNGCSYTVSVRLIIAFHADSGCYSLASGDILDYTIARGVAYLERIDSC